MAEACSFEEINSEVDNSHIQHYISSLHGYLNTGEPAVLLGKEYLLIMDGLCSNGATILRKQQSPFSGFIVNFYVLPNPNGIQVSHLPVPSKKTCMGFCCSAGENMGTGTTPSMNHSDGVKQSWKVQTKKSSPQFTTRDKILTLKMILGSTITVST
jgi:hypothetical protein